MSLYLPGEKNARSMQCILPFVCLLFVFCFFVLFFFFGFAFLSLFSRVLLVYLSHVSMSMKKGLIHYILVRSLGVPTANSPASTQYPIQKTDRETVVFVHPNPTIFPRTAKALRCTDNSASRLKRRRAWQGIFRQQARRIQKAGPAKWLCRQQVERDAVKVR